MRIIEHRALRGPNHYSRYPTAFMLLDIGDLEDRPSDRIPGFNQRLLKLLPSLREHRCSPGYPGGFVERLERGTWAAHIVEHVAIELQVLAGIDVGFGKTRETKKRGVYSVVYRYRDEEAGLQAGRDAVNLVDAVVARRSVDVEALVRRLRELRDRNALGPSTGAIVEEARRRGIPVLRLDGSYVQLGHGVKQRRIQASMTDRTGGIGIEIADDKDRTKTILQEAGVPVPRGETVTTPEGALEVAEELGWPVVVKPLTGNHGRGITVNVRTPDELAAAFEAAKAVHRKVVVEKMLLGSDHRILVVNHRFVAAARRDPAQVVGDGTSTVQRLIEGINGDPRRGMGHENVLTRIDVDDATLRLLAAQGLALDSVVPDGQVVALKTTANISSGGTATDVTDDVHPAVRFMAERISRIVGLDIMGVDVVAPDLRRPLQDSGGGVVEVNAAPGLRMHLQPSAGKPRNVAAPIVDMLFPRGSTGTIPIVAVTGTNGKTTTVRLLNHVLRYNGAKVGMATTTGVEIQNQAILEGDYSGPSGAQHVLREPLVDHAVLEVARGGILRRGLGFDECDVGILLNVASDHLGEGGIDTVEDLARLKSVVVEAVREGGTAILNAENPFVLARRDFLRPGVKVILVSLDPENPDFRQHVEDGGEGVTVSEGAIVLRRSGSEFQIATVRDVPITIEGHARFNVQNALAAVAAAHALGVPEEIICTGLTTFNPTVGQLPGRMNVLDTGRFKVVIDYGHNVPALQALAEVLPHLAPRGRRINVASAAGNRRDEDLRAFGRAIAAMYHHILLSDPDPRHRARGETPDLVRDGLREAGFPEQNLQTFLEEEDALDAAFEMAQEGDLVVLQVDDVKGAIEKVRAIQANGGFPLRRQEKGGPAPAPAQRAEQPTG